MKRSLSQSRVMEKKTIEYVDEEVIDQHLFIEGLALCAFDIPYSDPQPSNIEKVKNFKEIMLRQYRSAIS